MWNLPAVLLWVYLRPVGSKVWFPCIVWGSVCSDWYKMVIRKFDSSCMKTCFSKMLGMFLGLLFWYIPCSQFKEMQANKHPHHAIAYLGKDKWFLSYLCASTVEIVRSFFEDKSQYNKINVCTHICYILLVVFLYTAAGHFFTQYSVLQMSDSNLSLLTLADFAENLSDNGFCIQNLWCTFLIILKDWQKCMWNWAPAWWSHRCFVCVWTMAKLGAYMR